MQRLARSFCFGRDDAAKVDRSKVGLKPGLVAIIRQAHGSVPTGLGYRNMTLFVLLQPARKSLEPSRQT